MVRIEKATPQDARILAEISRQSFDNDTHYGAPGEGGPPGYDSPEWQKKMMRIAAAYCKIVLDGQIVGGFILFRQGTDQIELGRIFIAPGVQNQGVGAEACSAMHELFPTVHRWTLGTPQWNKRNHHFYEKMGYKKVGEVPEGDGPAEFLYEKTL